MAHEVSGHAYEIAKRRLNLATQNISSNFIKEAYLRGLDEQIAVALQNEYRSSLGLEGQRKKYTGPQNKWDTPIYNPKTKTWSLKDHFSGKMDNWSLPR